MDIGAPIRELGQVDMAALGETILALDEAAWREQELRQKDYNEVHGDTQSVVMVFCDGDWPEMTVTKDVGWDRLAEHAVPIMHDIIGRFYPKGGTILRAMAAKLKAGGRIRPHTDQMESFHHGHRIHVPVTTNNQVRFMIDGRPYRLKVGQAYEINNQKSHGVINSGKDDRITFIFDYVPGPQT